MNPVRRLVAQRHLAMLICMAALVLKLLVPQGYMIGSQHGRMTIELCSGVVSPAMVTMAGMHPDAPDHVSKDHGGNRHGSKEHGKPEMPCAFSGLSAASLGAVDPVLLAVLVAFIMAAAFCPAAAPRLARCTYLRPPPRGPPAIL